MKKRGRPSGQKNAVQRARTIKFDLEKGTDTLADLASRKVNNEEWDSDGRQYPKSKRSQGPNLQALEDHSPVLDKLLRLASNCYPDPYKLRDLLMSLHTLFKIFPKDDSLEANLSLANRAIVAADRWRIMCKHCLMLFPKRTELSFDKLINIVSNMDPKAEASAVTALAAPAVPAAGVGTLRGNCAGLGG